MPKTPDIPANLREPPPTKPRKLTCMNWYMRGGAPMAPLYLRTAAGTHYLVTQVRRTRPGSQARYVFTAFRITEADVPAGAKVFGWAWAPRAPKRRLAA